MIKKRVLAIVALLTLCMPILAYDFEVDGIYYNVVSSSEKTLEVTYKQKADKLGLFSEVYSGDVVIPQKVEYKGNLYSVVQIGNNAFRNNSLKTVEIPKGVITIDWYAFKDCRKLEQIKLPETVMRIEVGAFYNCESLESIKIPNLVTEISDGVFWGCSSLDEIEVPNSVTAIGRFAFRNCTDLQTIELPKTVTSIDDYAFENCTDLESIKIPNLVKKIESHVFDGCRDLKTIQLPKSIEGIDAFAFRNCRKLSTIKLAKTLQYIKENAFNGCVNLKTILIPNSVRSIGDSAFEGCVNLKLVEIPNSVRLIGNSAFENCQGLKTLNILNSLIFIKERAFCGCISLEKVDISKDGAVIEFNAFEGRFSYLNSQKKPKEEVREGVFDMNEELTKEKVIVEEFKKPEPPREEEKNIFTAVEQKPQFPGGEAALMKWISVNIIYPESAHAEGAQGRVVVQFVVEKDGRVGQAKVVRARHPDLDKEAIRLVKSLPLFMPGMNNGQPVRCWFTLPINFKLPK